MVKIGADGEAVPRYGSIGPPVDPILTTRVVEINDLEALERELANEDVACVLIEPALTNIGIVLPDPGYHEELRRLATEHGTLLIIDETHTLSCGPGGYTGAYGLEPDAISMGKPIAGGIPTGAYGLSDELAARVLDVTVWDAADVGGVGGTLAGNALQLAAVRATLGEVLTAEAYERMIGLAERYEAGVNDAIERHGLPWSAVRLGCRVEYMFSPDPPRNGAEARRGDRRPARRAHAPVHAQRGDPLHPVPHDGPDLAGDDRRAGRRPHGRVRADRGGAGGSQAAVSPPSTIQA